MLRSTTITLTPSFFHFCLIIVQTTQSVREISSFITVKAKISESWVGDHSTTLRTLWQTSYASTNYCLFNLVYKFTLWEEWRRVDMCYLSIKSCSLQTNTRTSSRLLTISTVYIDILSWDKSDRYKKEHEYISHDGYYYISGFDIYWKITEL